MVRPIFISIISTEPRITRADHTDHHTLSPLEAGLGLDWGVRRENDDTERGGNVPRAGQTDWSEVITLVTVDNVEIPPTDQQEDKSLSLP